MSYIVLARKWRPRVFDDLIGQETIVQTLKNAISNRKIVHAYLFSGPRGVGKTSTARILAKALNCVSGPISEPCGRCVHCLAITEGRSVDVIEIDGASNTQVESIRELRESVRYAPSSARYKIYIIDEVHMLSTSAFNALLKTLEEPPSHVIFIFATTEPKKIPSTIHSRCQHHAFRKIPKDKIVGQLSRIIAEEGIKIKLPSLQMIARAADGSMRDALTLLDQVSSFNNEPHEEEIRVILGMPEAEVITNLSQAIIGGDVRRLLFMIKELSDSGYDFRILTKELVEHFRNLSVVKVAGDAPAILDVSEEDIKRLEAQVSNLTIEQLTLLLTELLKLEVEVRAALNPRYAFELGLLKMSFVKGMTSIRDVLKMIKEPSTVSPLQETVKKGKGDTRVKGSCSVGADDNIWQRVVDEIDQDDHLLAGKLSQARVVELSSDTFTIGFNGGLSVLADLIKDKTPLIGEKLHKLTGRRFKINVITTGNDDIKKNSKSVKERVISEPIIQRIIRLFDGSIVEIKPFE